MRNIVTELLCSALLAAVVSAQAVGDLTTGQVRLPLDHIRFLEVSNGRRSRLATAGRSLLACAALGAVFGFTQKEGLFFSRGDLATMGAMAGAAAGFVVGLALPRGERWQPVSLPVSERAATTIGVIPGSRMGRNGRP